MNPPRFMWRGERDSRMNEEILPYWEHRNPHNGLNLSL